MATRRIDDPGGEPTARPDSRVGLREVDPQDHALWESRARVVLAPVAAPSVLGLYGFSAATFIVASNLAGWWGTSKSALYIAPFAIMFGGVAQFLAGMWSYKARDALATAMHGMWGAFWIAWGMLELMMGTGVLPTPAGSATYFPAFGFWFVMLGLITAFGMLAAIPKGLGLFLTLGTLSAGSCLLAAAFLSGNISVRYAGGWVLVASAAAAVYTASAMMLAEVSGGRTVLPLGKLSRNSNIPGRQIANPIQYREGMPGVRVGQ